MLFLEGCDAVGPQGAGQLIQIDPRFFFATSISDAVGPASTRKAGHP
jgi:hypothetical protein